MQEAERVVNLIHPILKLPYTRMRSESKLRSVSGGRARGEVMLLGKDLERANVGWVTVREHVFELLDMLARQVQKESNFIRLPYTI